MDASAGAAYPYPYPYPYPTPAPNPSPYSQLRLCCWGVPESGGWGTAAVYHPMQNSQSTDLSSVLSVYQANDHRDNQDKFISDYVKMMEASPSIQVPHIIQRKPPILYDADFNIIETRLHRWYFLDGKYVPLPPSGSTKQRDEWCVVGGAEFIVNWMIGLDLSAGMSAAGTSFSKNMKSSPFNETVHKDQPKIAQVHGYLPFQLWQ